MGGLGVKFIFACVKRDSPVCVKSYYPFSICSKKMQLAATRAYIPNRFWLSLMSSASDAEGTTLLGVSKSWLEFDMLLRLYVDVLLPILTRTLSFSLWT